MSHELGVDVGGTFTDGVLWDRASDAIHTVKVPSRPGDPSKGIFDAMEQVCAEAGIEPAQLTRLVHATTLIGNAVLERRGARTALVTTAGFRDVLHLRRELRYDLFEPRLQFPEPLAPRALTFGLRERVDGEGNALERPVDEDLERIAERLIELEVESVAVSLLHAYANPAHEEAVGEYLASRCPDVTVSLSSAVLPQIREYERTSATVLNAYTQPLAARYLRGIDEGLRQRGVTAKLLVMTSTGGSVSAETAAHLPILLLESGPAAGAVFAARFADRPASGDLVAFDMGGTTAKMCVVEGGSPEIRTDLEVGRTARFKPGSGMPIGIPAIGLLEISSGGGSIASVDSTGLIVVGPRSAGAAPGPACYGNGGTDATVTDANLVVGYLDEDAFLGGRRRLDRAAAEAAIERSVAGPAGVSTVEAAHAVHRIVTETMAEALRVRAAEVNADVRRFELVPFGGAAGLHAVEIARRLGIRRVLMPQRAGVFSAEGLLAATLAVERSRSWLTTVDDLTPATVRSLLDELEEEAIELIRSAGGEPGAPEYAADMSYAGQGFELRVPLPAEVGADGGIERMTSAFEKEYHGVYGRTLSGYAIRVVNWRVRVLGGGREMQAPNGTAKAVTSPGTTAMRRVFLDNGWRDVPVHRRSALAPETEVAGPALVQDYDTTLLLPERTRMTVTDHGSLSIELEEGSHVGA